MEEENLEEEVESILKENAAIYFFIAKITSLLC